MDQSQVESRMTSPFETTANISYKGHQGHGSYRLWRSRAAGNSSPFTSPSSLNGMSFAFAKDKLTVDYNGISFDLTPPTSRVERVAKMVVSAVNSATGTLRASM